VGGQAGAAFKRSPAGSGVRLAMARGAEVGRAAAMVGARSVHDDHAAKTTNTWRATVRVRWDADLGFVPAEF
jgi:hypothetical protein